MSLIDYRDRASVAIWVVLMGLAAQRLLVLPARAIEANVLGSPITLLITTDTILSVLLAGVAATGAEAVIRAHPAAWGVLSRRPRAAGSVLATSPARAGGAPAGEPDPAAAALRHRWVFWGLPVALVIVAVLLLPLAPTLVYWALGVVATGAALGLNMAGIYYSVDPFRAGYRRARLGLNALTYAVALLLFLVVYRTHARSIVSGTQVLVISSLLAMELLRGSGRPTSAVALYAGVTGLILGQATWVLNYWRLDSLTGGLVLGVLFYAVVGLAGSAIQGRVRRRVLLEYGLIAVAVLALIWEFAP